MYMYIIELKFRMLPLEIVPTETTGKFFSKNIVEWVFGMLATCIQNISKPII